ncbi:MAG: YqeG family HAD IIIA-type phosphatase [Clostridia bacterium]|nr:YqeG family HAD IIIA-type phosphatase [Clostridia bacterium]
MILYPKLYLNSVTELTIEILAKHHLKGLILDVDNTLIDINRNMPESIPEWIGNLKKQGISLCIVSNTNHKDKVEEVAKKLEIPYIYFAKKPFKNGFKRAKEILQLENEQIGVVGDQIMTDIIGANRSKMFPILVKPIDEKDIWITKVKRPIENKIIERYKRSKNVHK